MKSRAYILESMERTYSPVIICGSGTCMELTKAVCALLMREPNRSVDEAIKDVCRIYQQVQELTGLQ